MLNFKSVGHGRPLFVVHGLFGSSDNWLTLAGKFPGYQVFLPDLRNHGLSPWFDSFTHRDLASDLAELHDQLGVGPCPWAGHSLGGKAVMELALVDAARVTGLAVLDILPKAYPARYAGYLEALSGLDLAAIASRGDAQASLSSLIPEPTTLAFLLKNLVPGELAGTWRWRLNLPALEHQYPEIWKALDPSRQWNGPTLFLYGSESDYYKPGDEQLATELFPMARLEGVGGAGHWLHADKPAEVLEVLNRWLGELE